MSHRLILRTLLVSGLALGLARPHPAPAQTVDPAVVGERLQRLSASVESLELGLASQKRQIDTLGNEVQKVREEVLHQGDRRPWADDTKRLSDDVKRLSEAITEVDRKRAADNEQVIKVLNELRKSIAALAEAPPPRQVRPDPEPRSQGNRGSESGGGSGSSRTKDREKEKSEPVADKAIEHVMAKGQRLSDVVVEFNVEAKKKGYQLLTTTQVMNFNKISDARKIREGAKILLPLYPANEK